MENYSHDIVRYKCILSRETCQRNLNNVIVRRERVIIRQLFEVWDKRNPS
jgi:hypothetical protein